MKIYDYPIKTQWKMYVPKPVIIHFAHELYLSAPYHSQSKQ
jgi:hypothetical protein